jgi:hypothetical protein
MDSYKERKSLLIDYLKNNVSPYAKTPRTEDKSCQEEDGQGIATLLSTFAKGCATCHQGLCLHR